MTIKDKKKVVELYTLSSGHWCLNIQPCFPADSVSVLFAHIQEMSSKEKFKAAKHLHRQYSHPPFEFLKKVWMVFDEQDTEFLSILKKISSECFSL